MAAAVNKSVYISIGSNIEPARHIHAAAGELREVFGAVEFSPVYESLAVGFDGDNFLNLVARFHTDMGLDEVISHLRAIESAHFRDRRSPRFSARTLDLDLLLFGDTVLEQGKLVLPRPEIYQNAFVLLPLADLAPELVDPARGESYGQLWQDYDQASQKLWQIPFNFN